MPSLSYSFSTTEKGITMMRKPKREYTFHKPGDPWDGPVVFYEGVHYPPGKEGQPNYRLIWDAEEESYSFWDGTQGDHMHRASVRLREQRIAELEREGYTTQDAMALLAGKTPEGQ